MHTLELLRQADMQQHALILLKVQSLKHDKGRLNERGAQYSSISCWMQLAVRQKDMLLLTCASQGQVCIAAAGTWWCTPYEAV